MHTAPVSPSVSALLGSALRTLREATRSWAEAPGAVGRADGLRRARAEAAGTLRRWPGGQKHDPRLDELRELRAALVTLGADDAAVADDELTTAGGWAKEGWTGLWAAMLVVPAWQWDNAPRIEAVPTWFWADYVRYLFRGPRVFERAGDAERWAALLGRRLHELARIVAANRGSAAVRSAARAYLEEDDHRRLFTTEVPVRKPQELRQTILAAALGVPAQEPMEALSRVGRRLRVGVVSESLRSGTAAHALLPWFEHLAADEFEVTVWLQERSGSRLEAQLEARGQSVGGLHGEPGARIEQLRAARADVLLFGPEIVAGGALNQLALHRCAPLQVAIGRAGVTTGLPEIDVLLVGAATADAAGEREYSERLGVLPLADTVFEFDLDATAADRTWTREALAIPADAPVFVSWAPAEAIGPDVRETWAQLLAEVGDARLIVHVETVGRDATATAARLGAAVEAALARHGVASERVLLSADPGLSVAEIGELLRLGSLFLDPAPAGDAGAAVRALLLGLPVVTRRSGAVRRGATAALLEGLGLATDVAADWPQYRALAARLSGDAAARAAARARVENAMAAGPACVDALGLGTAVAAWLRRAFDLRCEVGADEFRRDRTPVRVEAVDVAATLATAASLLEIGLTEDAQAQVDAALATDPRSTPARQLWARILAQRGDFKRATEVMLAAVQRGDVEAAGWREFAGWLEKAGRGGDAVQALEAALRLDPSDVEAWFKLGAIAQRCGHEEVLREVATMVAQLAPDDPRTERWRGAVAEPAAAGA
jgi:tetratricopeptide (TPR) repeat protein